LSENPILSKPKKLIEEFFQLAEEDAERIVKSLEEDIRFFKSLQPSLLVALRPIRGRFDDFRVAAVDGSCTPAPAMKVGVGVSVITAGYMISDRSCIPSAPNGTTRCRRNPSGRSTRYTR